MKTMLTLVTICLFLSCRHDTDIRTVNFPKALEKVNDVLKKENVWVFILAGQSNMAGRALVEPLDTLVNKRILSINKDGQIIYAKAPLHFYESTTGLDCGISFATTLTKHIADSISILLIPTAVGGSSISKWLGDSLHRNVKLLSNFRDKTNFAKSHGELKGILWHQGENDADSLSIPQYDSRLSALFKVFRTIADKKNFPIVMGELGSYSNDQANWDLVNSKIREYSKNDDNAFVVSTSDFQDNGDKVHFNSMGQRLMGQRMAVEFLKTIK